MPPLVSVASWLIYADVYDPDINMTSQVSCCPDQCGLLAECSTGSAATEVGAAVHLVACCCYCCHARRAEHVHGVAFSRRTYGNMPWLW